MWSEIYIVKIPDRKLTMLFTNIFQMSEYEDADMRVAFEITGKSASVFIILWKAEELLKAFFIFFEFKVKSPKNVLSQLSILSDLMQMHLQWMC